MRDEMLCYQWQPTEEGYRVPEHVGDHCIYKGMDSRPDDGSHQCRNPNLHAGPHMCTCGAVWARGERLTGYRCLTYQASEPLVTGDVPEITLIDLAVLQRERASGIHVMSGNTIAMGRHENGGLVWYNVAGWDPLQQALVLWLDPIYETTRKDKPNNGGECVGTIG